MYASFITTVFKTQLMFNFPCSMAGFMLSNKALIVSGAFVGASGKSALVLFFMIRTRVFVLKSQ